MSKKCFKCGEIKPLANFYKHKQMADGHLNKCKKCAKKDVRANRRDNIDYYRAYDRDRGNRQSPKYLHEYRAKYPMKYAAHILVGNAVQDGRLKRPKECEACGSASKWIHGHHDDYAKPLEVRWLCPPCHKAWHLENGEAPNGC